MTDETESVSISDLVLTQLAGTLEFETQFVLSPAGSAFLKADRSAEYPPGTLFRLGVSDLSPRRDEQMILLIPADGTGALNLPTSEPLFTMLIPPPWLQAETED